MENEFPQSRELLAELRLIFSDLPEFKDPEPICAEEAAACRRMAEENVRLMRQTDSNEALAKLVEERTALPLTLADGTVVPVTESLRMWELEFQNQLMFFRHRPELRDVYEALVTGWYADGEPMTLLRLMTFLEVKTGAVTIN